MRITLCKRLLRRSTRCASLVVSMSIISLLITWTRMPALVRLEFVLKDNVSLLEDLQDLISQPIYSAEFPTNDTQVQQNASIFLRSYGEKCGNNPSRPTHAGTNMLCSCVPDGLGGSFRPDTTVWPWSTLVERHPELSAGGRWMPVGCVARQRVAVVIPFRDRDEHLRILLQNLHPMLQRQQIEYQIFVVEQAFPHIFNKASLMNIGFHEALKSIAFDCIIFHDVDMLPADDRQPYTCFQSPLHLGAYVDKYKYGRGYVPLFGGVTAFTKQHFELVNGFSNVFYGWGGEDDEMRQRIASARLDIHRYPVEVSRYRMLLHRRDHRNPVNPFRMISYKSRPYDYSKNGINNIKYKIHSSEEKPLYTWLLVEPVSSVSNYTLHAGTCKQATMATLRVPIHKCAEACDAHTQCSGFVFDDSLWCFLKRGPCPRLLPSESQRMYVRKSKKGNTDKGSQRETLNHYRYLEGYCNGNTSIGSLIVSLEECATTCLHIERCQSFTFLSNQTPERPCQLSQTACGGVSPFQGVRSYNKLSGRQYNDELSGYRRRPGDCSGGDLGGVTGITTAAACALRCNDVAECVGFVFASRHVMKHSAKCYLKMASCAETLPKDGVVTYDNVKRSQRQRYRRRPGDCSGGDIGGVTGVATEVACARSCDDVAKCVGFVFVSGHVAENAAKCYLKMASCAETLPKDGVTMYDNVNRSQRQRYRRRPGDCSGGDLGGVTGIATEAACALRCDDVAECVGFVFASRHVKKHSAMCYLKMASCAETLPKDGTSMYDNINISEDETSRGLEAAGDAVSRYRSRPGDCHGSDISGSVVSDINTCARRCDREPACVAFSYVIILSDYCWLKAASCNVTTSVLGVTTYDLQGQNSFDLELT